MADTITFEHANFEGRSQVLAKGRFALEEISIGNDTLSSHTKAGRAKKRGGDGAVGKRRRARQDQHCASRCKRPLEGTKGHLSPGGGGVPNDMRSWIGSLAGRLFVLMLSVGAAVLTPLPAAAQLAPTGGHYAARASDTGFEGAVNSQGGYDASVPLDLPEARGGLPVPLHISYGGNKVGAAGLGWDVALSYIFVDTTIAHRRPIGSPNAAPQARERVSLVLEGQRIDLLRSSTTASTWLARRNGAQLEVRDRGDGIMFMYDGEGRTYTFSSQGGAAGTRLVGGRLFLLNGISAPGGNSAVFTYQFNAPPLPGGGNGLAIDLLHVRFNKSPTNARCFKNDVLFSYNLPTTAPLSLSMLGNTPLVRVRTISKVMVFSRPSCTDSDVTLRTYTFNYQPDPDTQLPRLQSVRMNGQRHTPEEHVSLPVAAYTYGAATGVDGKFTYRKTKSIPLPTGADSVGISGSIGQFDFRRPNQLYGQHTSYFTWQSLTDINGDGRPDLTFREGPELMVAFNSPSPDGTTFSGVAGQQLTGGPGNDLTGRSLEARSSRQDRSPLALDGSTDMLWRQSIDVNGDGRLDLIDAQESAESWVVYLNTPSIDTPNRIAWVRRKISIARLVQHLREAGHDVNSEFLPLAKRITGHDTSFETCWEWQRDPTNDVFQWVRKAGACRQLPAPPSAQASRSDHDGVGGEGRQWR